jgi:hypothetical protein
MGIIRSGRADNQLLAAPKHRPIIAGGASWLLGTALLWLVLAMFLLL